MYIQYLYTTHRMYCVYLQRVICYVYDSPYNVMHVSVSVCYFSGYLHHIGAILLHPILQRAITMGVDPRTVDLSALREIVGKTFKDEDLQRLSFLLKQEVCVCVCVHVCLMNVVFYLCNTVPTSNCFSSCHHG